jgi:hypothetical protein
MQDVVDEINTRSKKFLVLALDMITKTWAIAIKSAVSDKISRSRVEGGVAEP